MVACRPPKLRLTGAEKLPSKRSRSGHTSSVDSKVMAGGDQFVSTTGLAPDEDGASTLRSLPCLTG